LICVALVAVPVDDLPAAADKEAILLFGELQFGFPKLRDRFRFGAEVIALLDRRSLRNRSADKGDFNHCRAILISQREDSGIGHPLAIDERVTGTSTPYPVTSAAQCADVLAKG